MLSEYCRDIAHNYKIKIGNVNKLVPNLNYVLYHGNRHLYLSLGTKLTRVHRILKLKQYDQLKEYIYFNTNKRKMQQIVLKEFFELMNNIIYGKEMEKLRKRINVKLVNNAEDKNM